MAKVTITLTDEDGEGEPGTLGTVNVRIESDPAFPGPAAPEDTVVTPAQGLGFALMEHLNEIVNHLPKGPGNEPAAEPVIVQG